MQDDSLTRYKFSIIEARPGHGALFDEIRRTDYEPDVQDGSSRVVSHHMCPFLARIVVCAGTPELSASSRAQLTRPHQ